MLRLCLPLFGLAIRTIRDIAVIGKLAWTDTVVSVGKSRYCASIVGFATSSRSPRSPLLGAVDLHNHTVLYDDLLDCVTFSTVSNTVAIAETATDIGDDDIRTAM